jgi:DegV family protein with EDD domain
MLKNPSISFRERVFILLNMVMEPVMIMGIVGDVFCGENTVEVVALIITVISVPIITVVSIKKNRLYLAVRLIVLGLVGVLLPILFYFGGGLHGGGIMWVIFAYLYTGLILSGMWKPLMLILLTLEAGIFYLHDYFHPERIYQHNNEVFHIDSFVALVMVGTVCCLMVWFVEWLFREENKRVQEEARKFEKLNKSRSRFFSNMSHEIRTPINSILGLNEIILRQEDASDEIRKDAANIQGAGRMLLALVNDILDVSKIEAGKMDIVPVNYSVASMISEIVNMIWLRAEQKGLKFQVEVDSTIPSELFGDEVRIKQILVNLLNNAVKYTREGSVTLHMEKEDIRDDSVRLLFSVTDTGSGIKQDALPYLFDAFRRVDEEQNRMIEGTGLGLSIVKQLVDLMGGEVTVNSVYTQGSTFSVSLWQKITNPIAVGDISITGNGRLDEDRKYEAGFTAPEAHLLLVDDNEMNLEVEKKLLEDTLIKVDTADSGEMALSMTTQTRYDVILMDHLMPEMDGIECMQRIRKQVGGLNNHAPMIALTANAGSENMQLYMSSGFDGYLLKPVSGLQLEETLLAHIPQSKVKLSESAAVESARLNVARGYSKKIPVTITTNSMCDLPAGILRDLQIDTIPFRIHVDGREYYDGIEADSDEIIRYMKGGKTFESSPPSVEEFEYFFAKGLRKAHQLIHITLATGISREYEIAKEAAKAYGNVFVFDSGYNSSSMGILALIANNMAIQGMTPGNIISELVRIKKDVHCSFMASDPAVLMKRGYMSRFSCDVMTAIGLKPFVNIVNDTFKVDSVHFGDRIKCFEKYVDYAIPRWSRPDLEVAFVTYSDVTEKELDIIEKRILSRAQFKTIIFQKASAALALSCGSGAFGILYMEEGDSSYNLGKLLEGYDNDSADTVTDSGASITDRGYGYRFYEDSEKESEQGGPEEITKECRWYDNISGIDVEVAITNSGSEEAFKSVLRIFRDSLADKIKEIAGYYDSENWEDYTIKVHALKSSARLVGALKIAGDAEKLEMAGKASDLEYIKKNHQNLISELERFGIVLAENFADGEREEEPEAEAKEEEDLLSAMANQNYDEFLVNSMYDALKLGVGSRNEKILKGTFAEMADYAFPEPHQAVFTDLKELFEKGDYEEMEKILSERK